MNQNHQFLNVISQPRGYIVGIKQTQDKGKGLFAIWLIYVLLRFGKYLPQNTFANTPIFLKDCKLTNNSGIRHRLNTIYTDKLTKQITYVDEADSIYPARSYGNIDQTEEILHCHQTTKSGNYLIYTEHLGRGVDAILRQNTQILAKPNFNPKHDFLPVEIANSLDNRIFNFTIHNISFFYKFYNRWYQTN